MTIATELTKLQTNLANSYTAVDNKGGTLPASENFDSLPTAINSITELKGETKTINPSTTTQTITPSAGKNGITSATVNPVTSSIDANITAGNIKKDVTILGVTGTFEGGVTPTGDIAITSQGKYDVDVTNYATAKVDVPVSHYMRGTTALTLSNYAFTGNEFTGITTMNGQALAYAWAFGQSQAGPSGTISFPNLTTMANYGMYYTFYQCLGINGISAPELTTVGNYGLYNAFYVSSANTGGIQGIVSFPKVTSIGTYGFYMTFNNQRLTGISFDKLETLSSANALGYICNGCNKNVSINFPKLKTVSGGMGYSFYNNTSLEYFELPALESVGGTASNAMTNVLYGCTKLKNVYFPKLTTISGYNTLNSAFYNCNILENIRMPEVNLIGQSSTAYGQLKSFVNKTNLKPISFPELVEIKNSNTTASNAVFYNAIGMQKIYLPKFTTATGTGANNLFNNCTGLTEMHFGKANQATIQAMSGYSTLWGRGAGSATVYFDLINTITVGGVNYTRDGTFYDYTNGYYSWTDSSDNTIYTHGTTDNGGEYENQAVGSDVYTKSGDTYTVSGTITAVA